MDICETFGQAEGKCILNGIGQCGAQVALYICNKHAELFSLVFKKEFYTNGDNDSWSDVATYVTGNKTFILPYFVNPNTGVLKVEDVKNYVASMVAQRPEFKRNEKDLLERICSLLGLSLVTNSITRTWLNDALLAVKRTDKIWSLPTKDMPMLHKVLLTHTKPSYLINESNGTSNVWVDNICLTEKDGNYAFVISNKSSLLKKTSTDSVATPLVLCAVKKVNVSANTQTIQTVNCQTMV